MEYFSRNNHYVPKWYQKRFIPSELKVKNLYYLDLSPKRIDRPDGGFHIEKECRHLSPENCFSKPHLYTLIWGQYVADIVEKRFFGKIDHYGSESTELLSHYEWTRCRPNTLNHFVNYLDAQKLRTPKGLDFIKLASRNNHQLALHVMRAIWRVHVTIWMEGVWEVLSCDNSNTKFLLTDHPVTTYNKALCSLSKECQYPFDAPIEYVGTHTIFPLDLNHCLVMTNLGYVRNPWIDVLKVRENPRFFSNTFIDLRKIQTGRQISEEWVLTINYINKKRARKYIAAGNKAWLYPEQMGRHIISDVICDDYFLMPDPRKVSFTTGIYMGYKGGGAWGCDEYGRRSVHLDIYEKALRSAEWNTFHKSQKEWDTRFGPLPREEWIKYF